MPDGNIDLERTLNFATDSVEARQATAANLNMTEANSARIAQLLGGDLRAFNDAIQQEDDAASGVGVILSAQVDDALEANHGKVVALRTTTEKFLQVEDQALVATLDTVGENVLTRGLQILGKDGSGKARLFLLDDTGNLQAHLPQLTGEADVDNMPVNALSLGAKINSGALSGKIGHLTLDVNDFLQVINTAVTNTQGGSTAQVTGHHQVGGVDSKNASYRFVTEDDGGIQVVSAFQNSTRATEAVAESTAKTCTLADTSYPLRDSSLWCWKIDISAPAANTGKVYVGTSSMSLLTGQELAPGGGYSVEIPAGRKVDVAELAAIAVNALDKVLINAWYEAP